MNARCLLPFVLLAALSACRAEIAPPPEPVAMTAEAVGHFCQMNLLEHGGPKGQVHLEGQPNPLFFSQVRDALAFKLLPEQEAAITAIYVSDMAAASSWDEPGAANWIDAESAFYVEGSEQEGGMGAPEMIPFGTQAAARDFASTHGGKVLRLAEIPPEIVLAADGPATDQDDGDFAARLQALAADRRQETTQ